MPLLVPSEEKLLLMKMREAAKSGIPLVVLLRADGTADIKLPILAESGYVLVKDRGRYHIIPFLESEVHRLPGKLPLLVAAENIAGGLDVHKALWSQLARDPEALRKLLLEAAERQGLGAEVVENIKAADAGQLVRIAAQMNRFLPVDAGALYRIVDPGAYAPLYQMYWEKKLITQLQQVLALKITYEAGWAQLLKRLLPLIIIAFIFIFLIQYLLPLLTHVAAGIAPAAGKGVTVP